MRLRAFQSGKGDCLLLESENGRNRILVDGGEADAYSAHVAPALAKLREQKKQLDAAYVSHIDDDHIQGILQLLDDEAAWVVHQHQLDNGNPGHKAPASPRPQRPKQIWHNSFHDQLADNAGPVQDLLAATATVLLGASSPELRAEGLRRSELAESIPNALRVSSRIRQEQLNIPLNQQFGGKLMMLDAGGPDAIRIGSMQLTVIGPFSADLDNLRRDWNKWLQDNQVAVKRLRTQARTDEGELSETAEGLFDGLSNRAAALAEMEVAAKKLGNRSSVTPPNLASLMFFVKEGSQTILLTGDGHCDDILKGLAHHKLLGADEKIGVNILKAQHHGSEHNFNQKFCDSVIAADYVFCGNGRHENPDLDVLQLLFDRRMAADKMKFRFWFNSSSQASTKADGRKHMAEVERLITSLTSQSRGRLKATFVTNTSFIDVT